MIFDSFMTAKMSVISNYIVVSLFVDELSSNLVQKVEIGSLFIFIAQKLIASLFVKNEQTLTQILVIF